MSEDIGIVEQELETIREQHGGVLLPGDVVTAAKRKTHPLHSYFEWDDSEAANKYRINQARALIRTVTVSFKTGPVTEPTTVKVRRYVSASDIGADPATGYRVVTELDSVERANLLQSLDNELAVLERKYALHEEFWTVMQKRYARNR